MPLAVQIPTTITACTGSFIDDLIRFRAQEPHAIPLAIHVTGRPHMGDAKPVRCRGLLSAPKLEAKGIPAEVHIVLGWTLNTRLLMIILPTDKFGSWSGDLQAITAAQRLPYGDLESTLGRLNHVAYLILLARQFLNKLRSRLHTCRHKNQELTLNGEEIADLKVWSLFLKKTDEGISINQVTI
jgi:hypothetical protein